MFREISAKSGIYQNIRCEILHFPAKYIVPYSLLQLCECIPASILFVVISRLNIASRSSNLLNAFLAPHIRLLLTIGRVYTLLTSYIFHHTEKKRSRYVYDLGAAIRSSATVPGIAHKF